MTLTLACILLSAAALALLGVTDAKRRRAAGAMSGSPSPTARRTLAATALAPAVALAWAGQASGFVIWLGALTLAGWALSLALRP